MLDIIEKRYHTERAQNPEQDTKYKDDFLAFTIDQLNNGDKEVQNLLSADVKKNLAQFELSKPTVPSGPIIRAREPGDKQWDCSFYQVLQRMFKADPTFKLKWSMYMGGTSPIPGLASVTGPSGPQGGGIAFKRRGLFDGVLAAIKVCEKSNP